MNITILVLFSSILIGVIFVEIFQFKNNKIQWLLTISGAYLLAICLLHLLPEIFLKKHTDNIGLYLLAGFLIQNILEYFSQGIEHGHVNKNKTIPFSILISLCVHALMEGLPLGNHFHNHSHDSLLAGIFLHKIPVVIVLMTFFLQSGMKKSKAYFLLFIFAIMSPIGVVASSNFQIISVYQNEIMAIIIGVLLHISTTILFESNNNHKISKQKIISILIGFIMVFISI